MISYLQMKKFSLKKLTLFGVNQKKTLKRYEFDRNGPKNASTLRAHENPLTSLKWVSKKYFVFLNP